MTKKNTFWVSALVLLQWSLFKDSIGARTCQPVSPFESPYVTPIYEQYSVGPGCYSSSKTSSEEEVHVINVKNSQVTVSSQRPVMFLYIRPIADTGTYNKPLIFVLNSERAVQWKIQTERLAHGLKHVFHVRRGSKVKTVGDVRVEVHKERPLPNDSDRLLEWTKSRYGVTTSFTEIQRADSISVRVGEESLLPPDCIIASNFFSPNTLAAYHEKQPSTGCAVPENEGLANREIHVIEVHQISRQTRDSNVQNVVLNVLPREEEEAEEEELNKDVLLILKGPTQVNWKVSAERMTGTLDILTNGNVDTDSVDLESLSISTDRETESLSKSGRDLVSWVVRHYGQPVSFTEAQLANMFNIYLRKTVLSDEDEPPVINLSQTKEIIRYGMAVDCHSQGIDVAVKRENLGIFDISGDSLSLEDRECRASANATHFILRTTLDGCGTQYHIQNHAGIFTNALVITRELTVEGSAMEPPAGSITGQGPISDDEDLEAIEIEFSCEYSVGRVEEDKTERPKEVSTRVNDYSMQMFETNLYLNEHKDFPWIVSKDHSQIHVQLQLKTDLNMFGVMPQNCWLSGNSESTRGPGAILLIENGCHDSALVTDDNSDDDLTGRFGMPPELQPYRFGFKVTSTAPQYLHCEITTCLQQKMPNFPLPLCLSQVERCIQLQAQPDLDYSSPLGHGHKYLGPFNVQGKETEPKPPNKNVNLKQSGDEEETEEPPTGGNLQPINEIIIGLETGAVVGIAFAAFVIGVLLTAALWYIHTHTGPVVPKQPQQPTPAEHQPLQSQHSQFGQLQGVTVSNGPTANGHAVHSYPYPSSMSTPMSAMST
ncbi:transforming growth factor beta receptor type 3-like [Ptychodera flava]|uniref:transforming growth factor beta receptor type 3-like n=1 Tax=Ptychodera flava TaxID=63121 RepID=UPI003969D878